MMKFRTPVALGVISLALAACSQEPAAEADTEAAAATDGEQNPVAADLDAKVMAALEQCQQTQESCGTGDPAGYLVFPDVTEVALGVGGGGGDGALVQNGQIVSYWRMGEGSVGLQAGVQAASYVFKVPDAATLKQYTDSGEWSIGADSGITIAQADANATGDSEESMAYIFNAEGLMADASIDAMKIWRTNEVATGGNASTDMTATDTTDTAM
ncbi:YSC84-related protein [Croceicoccus mobilis]|uniref:Lipoprotein n=2 Tax=Croceicoccus mobilis TaxID=1703339 RepID=A0A916Z4N9_9SPHN|nr:YSC84-related protein [Croceicoccus mobilis]GGD76108.1 lipoprotein [Croceicoccus mobilis]